jgi:hypothetical protein
MIAPQFVVTQDDDIVNSASDIDGLEIMQSLAVTSIDNKMMETLAARSVATDVQPLISQQTGDVLFIYQTQIKVDASIDTHISVVDLSLASSFVSEILSRIPEPLQNVAAKTLWQKLQPVGNRLPFHFCEILGSHNRDVLLPETLEDLNSAMLQEGIFIAKLLSRSAGKSASVG